MTIKIMSSFCLLECLEFFENLFKKKNFSSIRLRLHLMGSSSGMSYYSHIYEILFGDIIVYDISLT